MKPLFSTKFILTLYIFIRKNEAPKTKTIKNSEESGIAEFLSKKLKYGIKLKMPEYCPRIKTE